MKSNMKEAPRGSACEKTKMHPEGTTGLGAEAIAFVNMMAEEEALCRGCLFIQITTMTACTVHNQQNECSWMAMSLTWFPKRLCRTRIEHFFDHIAKVIDNVQWGCTDRRHDVGDAHHV